MDQLGRYEILSSIGSGGMGCVYRARMQGPGGASKLVALKVIHQHLAEHQDFVLMFLDETRVAMALSHRNIVQTFDAGEVEGRYFMVMELVDGGSLRAILDRPAGAQPLPPELALFIGGELSAALEYAHRLRPLTRGQPAGVVHRDVSPSNVLLSADGDVKLADFGIAKAAGRLYVTSVNLVRGKLRYMAPEQAEHRADPRSDLFSLGAVLYEMLTGQPVRARGDLDELRLLRPPPPPSSLQPHLPASLDALVLSCLEPSAERRPASAEELRRALAAEAFKLQPQGAPALDAHASLQRFLLQRGVVAPAEETTAGSAPFKRLAHAVIAQAILLDVNPQLGAPPTEPGAEVPTEVRLAVRPAGSAPQSPTTPQTITRPQPEPQAETLVAGAERTEEQTRPREPAPAPAPVSRRSGVALLAAVLGVVAIGLGIYGIAARSGAGLPRDPDGALPAAAARPPDARRADARRADARRADAAVSALAPSREAPPDVGVLPDRAAPDTHVAGRAEVRPRAFGHLDVNSRPWSRVYVDGRFRGETPLQELKLPAGAHQVRLVVPGKGLSRSLVIRVPAGRRVTRVVDFEAPP